MSDMNSYIFKYENAITICVFAQDEDRAWIKLQLKLDQITFAPGGLIELPSWTQFKLVSTYQ